MQFFLCLQVKDKSGDKKAKKKAAKKRKDIIEHREHLFHTQLVHITTACEVCNHPIRYLWLKIIRSVRSRSTL